MQLTLARVRQQWAVINKYPTVAPTTPVKIVAAYRKPANTSSIQVPLPLFIRQMVPHYNDPMGIRRALNKVQQTLKRGTRPKTTTAASPIAPITTAMNSGGDDEGASSRGNGNDVGGRFSGGVGSESSGEASDWAFERVDELQSWFDQDKQPDYHASPIRSTNVPGVGTGGGTLLQAERFRALCEITSDPQVAVRRLLLRHITGAVAYDQGKFATEMLVAGVVVSDVWLTFGEALALLHWVWRAFHPAQVE